MRPTVISASQASTYYYAKDSFFSPEGTGENSEWFGKGAESLGLEGRVKKKEFLNVITGCDPKTGEQLVQTGPGKEHRAGVDITFDAPKSVSVMALHVGDDRLTEAHREAVKNTLSFIEEKYSHARITDSGVTRAEVQGNIVASTFDHSTSRENDAQLHTHSLIMNMTETEKGWRAHWNDQLFKDQTLIRSVYQSELAKNVQDLGYRLEHGKHGEWEIAGVSKEVIETFSGRQNTTDNYLKEHLEELKEKYPNANDAQLRNYAVIESRNAKKFLEKEELQNKWEARAPREEIRATVESEASKVSLDQNRIEARGYVDMAVNAIHGKESTFTENEVLDTSLRLSRGEYTVRDFKKAFDGLRADKEIVHLGEQSDRVNGKGLSVGKDVFSSREMVQTEKGIVDSFEAGKGACGQILTEEKAREQLDQHESLTAGQREAVEHILTTKDRLNVIQGDAGTGKTFAMKTLNEIAQKETPDTQIRGLGFTGKASSGLEADSGIKSTTLHKFLGRFDPETIDKGAELWIVDESSMVGSRQMAEVVSRAEEVDAKVVFIGDSKQLQAIQAGRVFSDIQEKGAVKTVKMEEVLRQKTPHMREAVASIKAFQEGRDPKGIEKAFSLIKTVEIQDKDERIQKIVEDFTSRTQPDQPGRKEWQDTAVITPLNSDRIEINNMVHETFKEKGIIGKEDFSFTIRTSSSISGVDQHLAASYEAGGSMFTTGKIHGIKPGTECRILTKDTQRNTLTVAVGEEKTHSVIDLKRDGDKVSVYEEAARSFSKGERVVFLKNDERHKVQNGVVGAIKHVDQRGDMAIKLDSGKTRNINIEKYPYVDQGYALTVNKSQSETFGDILHTTGTDKPQMNSTESFNVAATRTGHEMTIYTDDTKKLMEQVKFGQDKSSTLDQFPKLSPGERAQADEFLKGPAKVMERASELEL